MLAIEWHSSALHHSRNSVVLSCDSPMPLRVCWTANLRTLQHWQRRLADCALMRLTGGFRESRSSRRSQQARFGQASCSAISSEALAAGLPVDKVFFSPFPLARTSIVVATRAWFVVDSESRETRLQRYLNEELEALHGTRLSTPMTRRRASTSKRVPSTIWRLGPPRAFVEGVERIKRVGMHHF